MQIRLKSKRCELREQVQLYELLLGSSKHNCVIKQKLFIPEAFG